MTFRKYLAILLVLASVLLLVSCTETEPPAVTTEAPIPTHPIESLFFPTGKESFADMGAGVLDLHVAEDNPNYTAVDGVIFTKGLQTLVAFPRGRTGAYTVPEGTLIIGAKAFQNCKIESIYLPDSVQMLSKGAFAGCLQLCEISLPHTLTAEGEVLPHSTITPDYPISGLILRVRDGNPGIPDPSGKLQKVFPELSEYERAEYGTWVDGTNGTATIERNRYGFLRYEGTDEVYMTYSAAYLAEGGNVAVPSDYIGVRAGDLRLTKRPIYAWTFPIDVTAEMILSYNYPPESMRDTLQFLHVEESKHSEFISIDGVVFTADKKTLVAFPIGRTGHYTVPDGVETIGEKAFFCTALESITFPGSIRSIHENAFADRWTSPENKLTLNFAISEADAAKLLDGVAGDYISVCREVKQIAADDVSVEFVKQTMRKAEFLLTVGNYAKTIEEQRFYDEVPTVYTEDLTSDGYPEVVLVFVSENNVRWSHARVFDGLTLDEYEVDYNSTVEGVTLSADADAFYIESNGSKYTVEKSRFADKEKLFDSVVTQNFEYDLVKNGKLHRSLPCQFSETEFYGTLEIDFAFENGKFVFDTAVFEAQPSEQIAQPAIEVADEIEKQAIDAFTSGEKFDFVHSVKYPRIVSDKPGADALNVKIATRYAPMIESLRSNGEGRELYRVGYNAAYTGKNYYTLMIHFTEYGGWQYSEGGESQRFFYYDGANDCELTVDEYLASMDIDKEKALAGALWSYDLARAGFAADYDGEMSEVSANTEYRLPESDEILGATAENMLYYQRYTAFADSVVLDGAYVTPETVTLYFSGRMYTSNTFTVTLDRETLMPVRPNYEGVIALTAADTDKIEILFENGKVVSATAPAAYADSRITVRAHKVTVYSAESFNKATLSVNGGVPRSWGNAGGSYNFYIDGYTEYDKLESVVFYLDPVDAPPVETAVTYARNAYNIYSGGVLGTQSVSYPRVTTGTAAAKKFNEKIAADYDPIIKELEKGSDYKIYNIDYTYAYTDGAMALAVDQEIGRQGTEGGYLRKMYYFDVTNDRELTMNEYAARMGVDIEKAKDGALWSYDLGRAGYGSGEPICSETLGGTAVIPAKNTFYFQKFGDFDPSVTVDGIAVSNDVVTLYLSGHAYIFNIFSCTLARDSLLPVRPNYRIDIDAASAKEGEFNITFADGKLGAVTLPSGVQDVSMSASSIHFDANIAFKADTFRLNGEKWGLGYGAGYDPDTGGYSYSFHPDPYIPVEKLQSITIENR